MEGRGGAVEPSGSERRRGVLTRLAALAALALIAGGVVAVVRTSGRGSDAAVRRLPDSAVSAHFRVRHRLSLGQRELVAATRLASCGLPLYCGGRATAMVNGGQTIRALSPILAAIRRRHLKAVSLLTLITQDPPSMRQMRAGPRGCPVSLRLGCGA